MGVHGPLIVLHSYGYSCLHRDRLEKVEAVGARAAEHAGNLAVPVHLLDLRSAVVAEEQLARHRLSVRPLGQLRGVFVLVALHTEVPEGDLVVAARRGKDAVLIRVPLDRGDRALVPLKVRDRRRRAVLRLEVAHIPHLQRALIAAGQQQVLRAAVPADYVDVLVVRAVDGERRAVRLDAHVPDADAAVRRARRKDGWLRRRPLQILDRARVALKRRGVRRKACVVARREEDLAVHVAGQEAEVAALAARAATEDSSPVHRVALDAAVCLDGKEGRVCLFLVECRAGALQDIVERADVPDRHLARLGPGRDWVRIEARFEVRRRRRRWCSTHAVHAAERRNRAVLEYGVLVYIVVVVLLVRKVCR